jgi:glycosyltransferase involved in cell wall biosynthesis
MAIHYERAVIENTGSSCAPWVLVAGGFHNRGGMDKANAALATYLLERKIPLHLVTHKLAPQFEGQDVKVHLVPLPAGSFLIGEWFLNRRGQAVAREVIRQHPGTRVVVNGGNCSWPDINWVHSVHHAWPCTDMRSPTIFKIKNRLAKGYARRSERLGIRAARVVLANSERTRQHVISFFQIDPDKVYTVYLGTDPILGPPTTAARAAARKWLRSAEDRPLVLFVGALSYDQNKGLDTLGSAWRTLCFRPCWDANLIVAGGGNGLGRWKSEVAKAGLQHRDRRALSL